MIFLIPLMVCPKAGERFAALSGYTDEMERALERKTIRWYFFEAPGVLFCHRTLCSYSALIHLRL
jgi:hypothetical protein